MKTNPVLGAKIHEYLNSKGCETPVTSNIGRSPVEKKAVIEENFRSIMNVLGLDLTDDSLIDTPRRVAKMYVEEIFCGLDYTKFPECTAIENKMTYDEHIIVKDINVQSNCEHHFVVISGSAIVAYIPNKKVIGLSKINRVVEFFCKRPQVQERLTEQIYHALAFILDTPDVAVLINAEHYCVKSRGVKDVGSSTTTSKLGGGFRTNLALRSEFISLASTK